MVLTAEKRTDHAKWFIVSNAKVLFFKRVQLIGHFIKFIGQRTGATGRMAAGTPSLQGRMVYINKRNYTAGAVLVEENLPGILLSLRFLVMANALP